MIFWAIVSNFCFIFETNCQTYHHYYHIVNPLILCSVLAAMTCGGGCLGLDDDDLRFTLAILDDARDLRWGKGQLEEWETDIRMVFTGRMSEAWKVDPSNYGIGDGENKEGDNVVGEEDFLRKNWNRIESGFRLWAQDWNGGDEEIDVTATKKKSANNKKTKKFKKERDLDYLHPRIDSHGRDSDEILKSKNWNDFDSGFRIF